MIFLPLLTAILLTLCGAYALRQNSRRPTNRILAIICFVGSIVQSLQVIARIKGEQFWVDHSSNPLPWVRARYVFIAILCPFLIWTCYYVVSGRFKNQTDLIRKVLPWMAVSAILMVLPFLEGFKPSNSRPDNLVSGPLFTVYLSIVLVSMLSLCIACLIVAPKLAGIRRLEFRFITITFGYLGVAVFSSTLINALFPSLPGLETLTKTLSYSVWIAFCASVWSVTTKKIFQSSQVVLPFAERLIAVLIVSIPALVALRFLPHFDQSATAQLGIVGLACLGFLIVDNKFRGILRLNAEHRSRSILRSLNASAANDPAPEELAREIETILSAFVDGTRVRILIGNQEAFTHTTITILRNELQSSKIAVEGWTSVVSLMRTEIPNQHQSLRQHLVDAKIHLLLSSHSMGHESAIIAAIDERENEYPFTHPEIEALGVLVEKAEALYTRSRLALQARQAEQLATIGLVGAGIAHELRNPIVTISTFAELLPYRLTDTAFLQDFASVVPSEGKRVQKLAEQLLDLAKPRKYRFASVELSTIIEEALVLVRKIAGDSRVKLRFDRSITSSSILADRDALRQVLLNLLLNAIQSVSASGQEGNVTVLCQWELGTVTIEVQDDGGGIPNVIKERLFQPFASAHKERGVGLGLAICAEIVRVHRGAIVGGNLSPRGAYFRLTLPIGRKEAELPSAKCPSQSHHQPQPVTTSWPGLKSTGEAS